MKKKILYCLAASTLLLTSCQNELYTDATKDYKSKQGAYMATKGALQAFVEESSVVEIKNIKIGLAQKTDAATCVTLEAGNQAQLDAYNSANGTEYIMLPSQMYDLPLDLTFEPQSTMLSIPLVLKDIKFSLEGNFALPIRIKDSNVNVIPGEEKVLLVLEQRINTKVIKLAGSGSEDDKMFPDDFTVNQWTMEMMIKRSRYISNNQALGGTKTVSGSSTLDEIFTRFGDVTIKPNQLQIKTASSQIDVPADKLSAQPDTWYMLSFVYDGKMNSIYVNGELVADREMRTGAYGLTGFWLSGNNEHIREVRFWKTARTPQQLKSFTWKMVDPSDNNLLLYYPLNGKKRDASTGTIVEDESTLWDWSNNAKHLPMPSSAKFDDNGGNGFVFPLPAE